MLTVVLLVFCISYISFAIYIHERKKTLIVISKITKKKRKYKLIDRIKLIFKIVFFQPKTISKNAA